MHETARGRRPLSIRLIDNAATIRLHVDPVLLPIALVDSNERRGTEGQTAA